MNSESTPRKSTPPLLAQAQLEATDRHLSKLDPGTRPRVHPESTADRRVGLKPAPHRPRIRLGSTSQSSAPLSPRPSGGGANTSMPDRGSTVSPVGGLWPPRGPTARGGGPRCRTSPAGFGAAGVRDIRGVAPETSVWAPGGARALRPLGRGRRGSKTVAFHLCPVRRWGSRGGGAVRLLAQPCARGKG